MHIFQIVSVSCSVICVNLYQENSEYLQDDLQVIQTLN